MGALININGKEMQRMEYDGVPVVTLKQVDEMHGKGKDIARRNFNNNRKHFVKGEDYFSATPQTGKNYPITIPPRVLAFPSIQSPPLVSVISSSN